jgi:predicted dehydrogenase
MNAPIENPGSDPRLAFSRRQFLKASTLAAATAAVTFPSVLSAQTKMPLNAVVIGAGGRGRGAAANFMEAAKIAGVDAKIVGVADAFQGSVNSSLDEWQRHGIQIPAANAFVGLDAYAKAIALPGVNYVIIATPPGFKPPQVKAAIEAGKHVFVEKPVAVDGPGCQIMYAAAELAKQKNLKIVAGTQRRHQAGYIDTIKRIQDGAIGDITALRAYWVNGGPIWHRGSQGATELEKQVRNWYHYIWLCGDHICEQHVHNLDVCNWVMKDHPVKAWGMGARQMLGTQAGEIWDNFAVEYEYPNGVRCASYCGQVKRGWSNVSEAVVGTKGTANPGGSISPTGDKAWRAPRGGNDAYVQEHVDLINAIVNDTPLNEGQQVTDSTLTAIMGREAAYSGDAVEWNDILNSTFRYGPDLLYTDATKMEWGDFRTLKAPLPGYHNIFAKPPAVPTA